MVSHGGINCVKIFINEGKKDLSLLTLTPLDSGKAAARSVVVLTKVHWENSSKFCDGSREITLHGTIVLLAADTCTLANDARNSMRAGTINCDSNLPGLNGALRLFRSASYSGKYGIFTIAS